MSSGNMRVISSLSMNVRRAKTRKAGKTRVNPTNQTVITSRNIRRKIHRLTRRVAKTCKLPGAPIMALITIQSNGQVCLTGSPTLCQVLKGTKGQDILEVAQKSVNKAVVPEPCKTVDLRSIDVFGLSLEDLHSTLCRKIYSRLCFNKGAKERGTYHATQKPEYWPREVPFCSHSAKGPDGKGRMISITQIKEVLECFRSYCAEKIQEGYQPINYVSTTTMDELQKLAGLEKGKHEKRQFNHEELQSFSVDDVVMEEAQHNDEKEDEEMADLINHNEWQSIGTDRKVKGVGQDIGEVDINIDELKHEELSEIRLEETGSGSTIQQLLNKNDIDGCISYIVKNWPLEHEIEHIAAYLQRSKPIQIDSMPDRFAKRRYRGPSDMVPGKEYSNIWEVLHEFPSLARLHVFLFATEHIDHYVAQYEEMDSSLYEIKLAMKRFESSAPTIKDFFTEEALSVLTDMMRGPITYMLIAGALKATITIYEMNRGAISFPPCPCDEADSQQFIWIDRRERVFGLSQEHVWSGRQKNTTKETLGFVRRVAQLPGIHDGIWLRAYGYEIWRGEVQKIKDGQWLDDSIVNVMLRHKKEQSGRQDVFVLDSNFARVLMVPAKCADKRTKLSLTSFNKSEADKFYKHIEVCEKELIIIPICDNIHWFLAALYPRKGQLYIICSLGQTYKNVAYTLKRYFLPRVSRVVQDIAVSYPKVPRQNNGIDCGVFTIYYGSDLIQNHKDWTTLGGHGSRVKLLKELEEMK